MRMAFIVSVFPAMSEYFILQQITGLIDRGHDVDIFASFRGKYSQVHEEVQKYRLLQRTFYRPSIPASKFNRLLKGLYSFVSNFHRNPAALIRSLDVFKHKKEAANLHLLYRAIPFVGKGPYDIIHAHFGPHGLFILTIDIDFCGYMEIGIDRYYGLRQCLAERFDLREPEITVHPLDILHPRNGPFPYMTKISLAKGEI